MNVPLTYPPKKVNGIMISGFLAPDLESAAYPKEIGPLLKAKGYIIDSDTELAKKDLVSFYNHLNRVLDKRIETMMHFFENSDWDFFMTHIMETDRLHHFFWEYMEKGMEPYAEMFNDVYRKIDLLLRRILNILPSDTAIMMLSDHGFTVLNKEVYINRWLEQNGWLQFTASAPLSLKDIHLQAAAYSLYPGRIYLNVQGREKHGWIRAGLEYEQKKAEIRNALLNWRDESGRKIIKQVLSIEELYGRGPIVKSGQNITGPHSWLPDLTAIPFEGFDLKGNLTSDRMFKKTIFNGMHTFDDAFVLGSGIVLPGGKLSIDRLSDSILKYFQC
jgi:predicted AlkP superfamily phosphohydrolase/phosphomutase